jgi:hypothetical protein
MKNSTTMTTLFLLVLLLIPKEVLSQNQIITVKGAQIQVSAVVQKVLKQAENVYVNPTGFTINNLYNEAPVVIPTFIGLIMHRQRIIMKEIKNVEHLNNASALDNEIMAFLEQLAQAHNYSDPVDITSMPAAKLNVYYFEALRGNQNANFIKNMGIDPAKVNIAYLLDRSPDRRNAYSKPKNQDNGYAATQPVNRGNRDVGGHGKLQLRKDKNEINIFGEVSGAAIKNPEIKQSQDIPVRTGVEGLVCPERNPGDDQSFIIDTNNNPNDKTYCYCSYFGSYPAPYKNNLLKYQKPLVDNKMHGTVYEYEKTKSGMRYLNVRRSMVNGKRHGITEAYMIYNNKPYLSWRTEYSNDKRNGVDKNWTDHPFYHLRYLNNYVDGKQDGRQEDYGTTKSGHVYLSREEYYINGVMKTVYTYDTKGKIIPALSSPR